MKLTRKQEQILAALRAATGCLSARELAAKLPDIDQATVYRNLDRFTKEGIVKKHVFDGSEAVYDYAEPGHHHAVCADCEKVIHFSVSDEEIIKKLDIKDFDIESVDLVVRGKCRAR